MTMIIFMETACADESLPHHGETKRTYNNFPHIFGDIENDLSSEIVFALENDSKVPRFET